MIEENNIERLSDEERKEIEVGDVIKWVFKQLDYVAEVLAITDNKEYCVYVIYQDYTGGQIIQEHISQSDVVGVYKTIKKQAPADSVEKSCEVYKVDDILEFQLEGKPHKRNSKLYRVKQVHNPKIVQHKHTYELIGIHDGLSVDTDGANYTLKLCCVDCSRIKLAEKYPHQSNLICQSCNEYDMYEKIKPKPLPKQTRPMTAIEIAQFIAKTGYAWCSVDVLGGVLEWFPKIDSLSRLKWLRYLKPDDDTLYKFDEV